MRECTNWRLDPGRTNWSTEESPRIPFALLWKKKLSGQFSPRPPLDKIGNNLFFTDTAWGEDHALLYCFSSDTGEEKWRFRSPVAGAMLLGGVNEKSAVVYQGMGENGIIGVNLADGAIAWRISKFGSMSRFGGIVDGDETILSVVDQSQSTYIARIDHKTGRVLGQFKVPYYALEELSATKNTICGIVVSEEKAASQVVAFSRNTGEMLWTTDVLSLDDSIYGPPQNSGNRDLDGLLIAKDQIFVTQFSGKLWCLDINTGKARWNYSSYVGYLYVPTYADQKLYFRKWEHFVCVDASTGAELYAAKHGGIPTSYGYAAGTVAGNYFFFSDNTALFALNLHDGSEAWRQDHSKKKTKVWGPCLVSDGRLFVTGGDNYVYCFGPK